MSKRAEAMQRTQAVTIYKLRQSGYTNKQIAQNQGIDVKRVPALVKLGGTLATLLEPKP